MIFAGIGAWLLFQKKVNRSFKIQGEMAIFALIIGFLGIYFSSAFVRLEVFGAISVIILSSIGLSILISKTLKAEHKPTNVVTKISFLAIIVILLMVPMVYPENNNWTNQNEGRPITILSSGAQFDISTNDWYDAMQWLKENTSEDAVIASWWDYGYWISTLAERKTLADNATLIDWQIRKIASTFMSTPDHAWQILTSDTKTDMSSHYVSLPDNVYDINQSKLASFKNWKEDSSPEKIYDPDVAARYPTLFDYWVLEVHEFPPIITGLDADYVLINLAVKKLTDDNIMDLYTLKQHGGDETKTFWFIKIADLPVTDYMTRDLQVFTDKFWNETLLGKLIPFTPIVYVDPDNTERQSDTYMPGYIAIYAVDVKFPPDGQGPFQLVYSSPSFAMNDAGPLTGPIIYKINKEYIPNQ
jgi:dolichyl-diphosphooligosaccharide--protein glycosyltransferase